jgi:hypothetical protein
MFLVKKKLHLKKSDLPRFSLQHNNLIKSMACAKKFIPIQFMSSKEGGTTHENKTLFVPLKLTYQYGYRPAIYF